MRFWPRRKQPTPEALKETARLAIEEGIPPGKTFSVERYPDPPAEALQQIEEPEFETFAEAEANLQENEELDRKSSTWLTETEKEELEKKLEEERSRPPPPPLGAPFLVWDGQDLLPAGTHHHASTLYAQAARRGENTCVYVRTHSNVEY